jgi:hypothetical protein
MSLYHDRPPAVDISRLEFQSVNTVPLFGRVPPYVQVNTLIVASEWSGLFSVTLFLLHR